MSLGTISWYIRKNYGGGLHKPSKGTQVMVFVQVGEAPPNMETAQLAFIKAMHRAD